MGSGSARDASKDAVTASELARHFGHWQRRALQSPVYVLHHGRPQFVLASIEFMQALTTGGSLPPPGAVAAVVDALIDPVMICDPGGTITAANRAARLFLGKAAQPGTRLDALLDPATAALLHRILTRVAERRIAEMVDLPAAPGRARLDLRIEPSDLGVIVVGRAAGPTEAADAAIARVTALAEALSVLPRHALATVNLRGRIVDPGPELARLTGQSRRALSGASLADLFAAPTQAAIRDRLEQVITDGSHCRVDAEMLVSGGAAMSVSVGLAPVRRGLAIDGAQVVIAPRK